MKRLVTACALASTLALATASTALAAGPAPLRVSHGDPFAACLGGGNAADHALNYRSAEVEPWVTDNPANTDNLIGTWQQDRWSDGGAKGQVAAWTFDAGQHWGQTPQPFTTCAQPFYRTPVLQYERTSDPWASFGPDGTAYAVSLPFDGDFIRNGLGTAVSHDGGRTWVHQQDIDPLIASPDTLNPSDDKQAVTADPLHPGWAYVVWEQFHDVFPPACSASRPAAVRNAHDVARRGSVAAPAAACDFTAPTYFSRTTDFGVHWSKPVPIVPTGVHEQTIANQVVINRQNGTLYDFYDYINVAGENNIEVVISTTQGATWSGRMHVQRMATNEETNVPCGCGVTYPGDPNRPVRTGDIIPSPAIDPNTGRLYVVWQDGRANPDPLAHNDMLYISTSSPVLPLAWSPPVRVNPPDDKAAFTAALNVNSRGQVGVLYYDFTPPLPANRDILPTDTWLVTTDGPGLHFGDRKLVGGPFNMEAAPIARGFFTGDYMGLAAKLPAVQDVSGDQTGPNYNDDGNGNGFVPLFVMTNCQDNSCRAVGTPDGAPAGPDSTDAFSPRA
jgi:hypothetical protein